MAMGSSIALDGAMKAALRQATLNHCIKQHSQLSGDGYRLPHLPNSQALLEVLRPCYVARVLVKLWDC